MITVETILLCRDSKKSSLWGVLGGSVKNLSDIPAQGYQTPFGGVVKHFWAGKTLTKKTSEVLRNQEGARIEIFPYPKGRVSASFGEGGLEKSLDWFV